MKTTYITVMLIGLGLLIGLTSYSQSENRFEGQRDITIHTLDISQDRHRQTVIAQGTDMVRQGHPTAVQTADNTLYVMWTYGHGGPCGPMKKSEDGGMNWSDLLHVPENWILHSNCPAFYTLKDPDGKERIISYVSRGPAGFKMYRTVSEDNGNTWSPFRHVPVVGNGGTLSADVMPFTSIVPIENGKKLLGVTNTRRPYEGGLTNILVQSISEDGGLSWSHWRFILDLGDPFIPCEPEIIRSPDGKQLLMLIRENNSDFNSWIMLSDNEGKTWSEPFQAPASITMDRHQAKYADDGRLVIVGRDVASNSPTKGHFVAWVGSYEDLVQGKEGEFRIKLLHTYRSTEYPSLIKLPDGTFLAINSVGYQPNENYSVVATRFTLDEMDRMPRQ